MTSPESTFHLAPIPRTIDELGLSETVIVDLILRRILFDGRTLLSRMSQALGLTGQLTESIVRYLREDKKYVDFESMVGRDWLVGLTEIGKKLANDSIERISYAGIAPVSLSQYRRVVAAQTRRPVVTREAVRSSFNDLVVSDRLVDEVGPAMMGEGAIFLYGPPGTGKSSVAERLTRLLGDTVLIPRAIEVDGAFILVYDPTVHHAIDPQPDNIDPRWVVCQRPSIVVGGELTRSQLDLIYDKQSGLHLAPLQLKANNGILVIDDFGRQQMSPSELLNRWIVPLDRSVDYLTLAWGVRFDVPFDTRVVFSTNLDPATLGDEAFYRRLPNKVYVGSIDNEQFDWILVVCARKHGLELDADSANHLRMLIRTTGDGDLRPYVPNVACQLAKAICMYEGLDLRVSRSILDRVASLYFTKLTQQRSDPIDDEALHRELALYNAGEVDCDSTTDRVAQLNPEGMTPF